MIERTLPAESLAFAPIRREVVAKFGRIIRAARRIYGEDPETSPTRFAEFKHANPDLFAFEEHDVSPEHIDIRKLDLFGQVHTQVFVWAWVGELGFIGYPNGHIEETTDRALFDEVVFAGKGLLHAQKLIYTEDGVEKAILVPAGPFK